MRVTLIALGLVLAMSAESRAQFRGPGGFGGQPGFAPGGMMPPGGSFQGKGRSGMSFGAPRDPNQIFEMLARGRPYIVISEMRSLRDPLTAYAKENGITNDQVTRQQFATFYAKMDQYKSSSGFPSRSPFGAPPGAAPGTPPPPGSPPAMPGAGPNPLEAISQWAENDFRRRDQNGDGRLNTDEMAETLRGELDRWDTDRDGTINVDEYKVYYSARLQMRDGTPNSPPPNPITILIEEDYDRRPEVFRVGKLPKDLPKWFAETDSDEDGQVALFEWHKKGKDLEEFRDWDRNNDGLVTVEEVLFKQKNGDTSLASSTPATPTRGPGGFGGPGGFSGFGGGRPSFNRGESSGRPGETNGGGRFGGFSGFGGFGKKKS